MWLVIGSDGDRMVCVLRAGSLVDVVDKERERKMDESGNILIPLR